MTHLSCNHDPLFLCRNRILSSSVNVFLKLVNSDEAKKRVVLVCSRVADFGFHCWTSCAGLWPRYSSKLKCFITPLFILVGVLVLFWYVRNFCIVSRPDH